MCVKHGRSLTETPFQSIRPPISWINYILCIGLAHHYINRSISHPSLERAINSLLLQTTAPVTCLTEVLVSQIHPDSPAARDGRIKIGDQILQVS